MSLEGSLETIALPEVLHLLSDTSKSGELLVSGDRGDGRLWFDGGKLSGFDVKRCVEASDALFELLRAESGRFAFDAGGSRPDTAQSVGAEDGEDVRPILEVAQAHLEEWSTIVAVVPSLEHRLSLAAEAPKAKVTLLADQWSLVVTIGEGRSVGEVLDRAGLSEFEGCRSLKTLVEEKLVSVSEAEEVVAAEEPEAVVVPEPVTFEVEEPEPVSVEPAAVEDVDVEPVAAEADPAFEVSALGETEKADESSNGAVVNSGVFDGQDFVFKAPSQPSDDDYEPQPVPFPDTYSNGHAVFNGSAEIAGDDSMSSRAALEALLAEIPADGAGDAPVDSEAHDGLADRGPWTSQELASFDQMGGWQDGAEHNGSGHNGSEHNGSEYDFSHVDSEEATAPVGSDYHFEETPAEHTYEEHAVEEHAAVAEYEAVDEHEDGEEEAPQPEPVNRGLLLKFLSSVRS